VFLVALTGWGQEADQKRSHEAGFDAHLVKPADLDTLMNLLRELPTMRPHATVASDGGPDS
jgi:CheY-like chemotaxis protein